MSVKSWKADNGEPGGVTRLNCFGWAIMFLNLGNSSMSTVDAFAW